MVTSGIRIGTPAGTTRGFGTDEFRTIGKLIGTVVSELAERGEDDQFVLREVLDEVEELTSRYPIY